MIWILEFYDFPTGTESGKFYQTKIDILNKRDGKSIDHIETPPCIGDVEKFMNCHKLKRNWKLLAKLLC